MPGSSRKAAMQMTQGKWETWAQQRIADAVKIARQYKREGESIQKMLLEKGCTCNPLIVVGLKGNSPDTETPSITHSFDCKRG